MTQPKRQQSFFGFDDEAIPKEKAPSAVSVAGPALPLADNVKSSAPPTQTPEEKTHEEKKPEATSVWVIDAHSLIHQVFHALPDMKSPQGDPVGAVFGFTRDLFFLMEEKRPDYLFCAFDLPGKTFRHAMYESYKEQRAAMPDDLRPQIPAIRRVLTALGIPALDCESFEADDVLATVARMAEERGNQCYIVTNDKDARQLITDRVAVYSIRKNELYDAKRLQEEWGITPTQVVDYQALVGDSVDNVPGVPLIGPKFAKQLIEQFGTLDAILEHAQEVPGAKRQENLVKYREQALLSRKLVELDRNVPLSIDWENSRVGQIDRDAALKLFEEFGFRTMGQKLERLG
jgi:DNA polymerase-1